MGDNKHIEELHAFAIKYVKEIPKETPSADFTASLMHKIAQVQPIKSTLMYQPLITKKGWFLIIAVLVALVFIPFGTSSEVVYKLPQIDFSFLTKIKSFDLFEMRSISNTTFVITIIFGLFMAIQLLYLKGYFERKIQEKF